MKYWRGVKLDDRSAAMMDEVVRLTGVPVRPSQGSYNGGGVAASAGTHDGGGAIDISAASLSKGQRDELVYTMRKVGWACWYRPPSSIWGPHLHAVAVSCPDLSSGAAHQVREYFAGRNGLANRGPDDGPRDFVGATWEKYLASKPTVTIEDGEDVPTLVLAPGRPAAWVIGSSVVFQSAPGSIKKTAGPDVTTIEMTAADFDKWQREGVAPSLPNRNQAGYVAINSNGTGYLLSADLSTKTVLAGVTDLQAVIAAGVPEIKLSDDQIAKAVQVG